MKKRVILDKEGVAQKVQALAEAILERHGVDPELVLVGIRTGGAYLAVRLQAVMAELTRTRPPVGILDITLYRDDWTRIGPAPVVGRTELPFTAQDKIVVLVDDVLFTGRTVRAAMDALMDYGRPRRIELAVLVDRGVKHRELPIMANYSSIVRDTAPNEVVNVYLAEEGYPDHVAVEAKDTEPR